MSIPPLLIPETGPDTAQHEAQVKAYIAVLMGQHDKDAVAGMVNALVAEAVVGQYSQAQFALALVACLATLARRSGEPPRVAGEAYGRILMGILSKGGGFRPS